MILTWIQSMDHIWFSLALYVLIVFFMNMCVVLYRLPCATIPLKKLQLDREMKWLFIYWIDRGGTRNPLFMTLLHLPLWPVGMIGLTLRPKQTLPLLL